MLKLDIRQNPPRSIWLVTKVTVGKNPQNDVVLNVSGVDDFHLTFTVEGDTVYLTDKSTQGTFVNSERVNERVAIKSGDWITVGDVGMDVIDPKQAIIENRINQTKADRWVLRAITGWLAGQEIPIESTIILGRDKDCDVTIPGTHLSRHHAQITVEEDRLHVRDLESANGTFLNGERITEADVVPGDEIRFDLLSFFVLGPDSTAKKDRRLIARPQQNIIIDTNPAVRIGEAKPTSMGNSEEYVEAYNQQVAALKAEKKRQAKQQKRDTLLGWLIVILVLVSIMAVIYYFSR